MSGDIDEEGAQVLTDLDAVGNTTKAITKGIAIATAVLAATALFGSYPTPSGGAAGAQPGRRRVPPVPDQAQYLGILNIADPRNLVGLIIGAAVVFFFSGLAISAVSRAAGAVVFEVRDQFREHPGIMDLRASSPTTAPSWTSAPRTRCASSRRRACWRSWPRSPSASASASVRWRPTWQAPSPPACSWRCSWPTPAGHGTTPRSSSRTAPTAARAPRQHAATVIGDTVGDPFKDTAGPAINPLIKVMNLVALLIAPAVVTLSLTGSSLLRWGIAALAAVIVVVAIVVSKRRPIAVGDEDEGGTGGPVDGDAPDAGAEAEPVAVGAEDAQDG